MNSLAHVLSNPLSAGIDARLPSLHRLSSSSFGLCALAALGLALGNPTTAMATTYVVNTTEDPGPAGTTSLREAVAGANLSAGNLVAFDANLVGSTFTLARGEISFEQPTASLDRAPDIPQRLRSALIVDAY
jgi:hypothetical protein